MVPWLLDILVWDLSSADEQPFSSCLVPISIEERTKMFWMIGCPCPSQNMSDVHGKDLKIGNSLTITRRPAVIAVLWERVACLLIDDWRLRLLGSLRFGWIWWNVSVSFFHCVLISRLFVSIEITCKERCHLRSFFSDFSSVVWKFARFSGN